MKKNNKSIGLFVLILLSLLIICPQNTFALTKESSFVSVEDVTNIEVGDLLFSNIMFKNSMSTSNQTFGLSGSIINKANNSVYYSSVINYYDSNRNFLAGDRISNNASQGTSIFNHETSLSLLGNHNTSEIAYYSWSITVSDNATSNDNSTIFTPSKNNMYSSLEYVIDKYDIDIVVNENNTFDITENITTNFNASKHGIFRTIPIYNEITRLDGTTSKNRAQLTNLTVNKEFSKTIENGNYKIKIGSDNKLLYGEQNYVIKYTYNIGKDPVKDYDELYYNIIGNEWDTVIGNVTFKITMPKEFDSSKLGFSSGRKGSTNNSNIKYTVDGNVISGNYNGILNVGESLTIRCELDEGYFVGAGYNVNILINLMFIIPILGFVISFIIWFVYGRDNQVVETVEFYPPKDLNSLEVAFLYNGFATDKDATSLLIYLANKGYIKITEIEEKKLFIKSKNIKLTKLKEYDGNNINERLFLEGLFSKRKYTKYNMIEKIIDDTKKNGKKLSYDEAYEKSLEIQNESLSTVTVSDLRYSFYHTTKEILKNINNRENKDVIYVKENKNKSIMVFCILIFSLFSMLVIPTQDFGLSEQFYFNLTLFMMYAILLIFAIISDGKSSYIKFLLLIILVFHAIEIFSQLTITTAIANDSRYFLAFLINFLCIVGMMFLLKKMPKRSEYGNELLGKIRGFKNFLKTAEKEKLESLVMENPSYFYDILPYTYVLGVSDKWIKKFEKINLQPPSWYDSPNTFEFRTFEKSIKNTMKIARQITSSSSGSSSGGGSSGGGSGGGGGGSW